MSDDPAAQHSDRAALAEFAIELATGAAEVVRNEGRAELRVTSKSTDTDLVTVVDRASERWLVSTILQRRPGDAVLGEETGENGAGTTGVRWVIDPIDGTVNFVLGLPQYAVSVAAEVDGQVVAGAVCNPATGELFTATLGGGAYLDGTRLTGPRGVPVARAVVATGFAYAAATRARQAAVVARLLPRVADIRRLGASSLDLCGVASGRLDAYYEAGLHAWDYAAGALVAAEAGCVVGGLRGGGPSDRFTVVSGPSCADELFALLEELGADRVLDA